MANTEKSDNAHKTGGCLCGAVRYRISGAIRDIINCHCTMCQKLHGSLGAHAKVAKSDLTFTENSGLAWYQTSDVAKRGFCRECGSSLFWWPFEQEGVGVLAGSIDQPTGLKLMGNIYVAEKADFCDITDTVPCFSGSSAGKLAGDAR